MRKDVYNYIVSKKDLQNFIREQPIWYQELSRRPWKLKQFEQEAMKYYKKTIPDRVEKVSMGMNIAYMMLSMLENMNQST